MGVHTLLVSYTPSFKHTYLSKNNTSKPPHKVDVHCFLTGTLMGITNAVATIPGFVGPSVVGALTYKNVSFIRFDNIYYSSNINIFVS